MITENRIINRKNLKQLCIDFDLYTLGNFEEYIVEKNAGNHKITTRDKMITAFLIGTLLFLAAFMINIYIIRRF